MNTEIFKCTELANRILLNCQSHAESFSTRFSRKPCLAVILVGDDPASSLYVKKKSETCEKYGIKPLDFHLKETDGREKLCQIIQQLNQDPSVDGILLQSPIPKQWKEHEILTLISPEKDADGFHPYNVGLLTTDPNGTLASGLPPCTPAGVMEIFKHLQISLEGSNAVVLGRSNIVGKPMATMLLGKSATVTVCHSKTQNLRELVAKADVIVSAIGKPKFLQGDWIKPGAIVIDVGINRAEREGRPVVVGDVDRDSLLGKAALVTPVPFGVGPMTIAMLLRNTVRAAYLRVDGSCPL